LETDAGKGSGVGSKRLLTVKTASQSGSESSSSASREPTPSAWRPARNPFRICSFLL
jgi:hypothetical protein